MNLEKVKEVRQRSGSPLGDCKVALDESAGDVEKALLVLQKRGIAKAVEKSGRITTEGRVHSYIHPGNRVGVIVEVNCETDFVAKNPDFIGFCDEVSMQIAAMKAEFVNDDDIAQDQIDQQYDIFRAQLEKEGKPQMAWEKIVEGKLSKWKNEVCLLRQESVLYPKQTIEDRRLAFVSKFGENIRIRRFERFELGA